MLTNPPPPSLPHTQPTYMQRRYGDAPEDIGHSSTASTAWEKSCYFKIDFKISQDASVYEAVQKFAAYNIGCLVVMKGDEVAGIISERDYVTKIALLGRKSVDTKVSEVCTSGANMVVARTTDSVQECMGKMLARDIRHLPVVEEETGQVVGMLSVKDLIKELVKEKDEIITKLTDFTMGRGAFFEHV
uniref:CBS domain-containing protein n=1 Tax=Phaeomonas parva TaxID=124430 RepID=A0A7S1XTH5_9STRA|mmetsp:Transcript_37781/g.118286  ORF Transcript_37781/g.118286 Transcript_37781/m.118286 type:complete len:188 (+) Transcript_37781:632-1195(+)